MRRTMVAMGLLALVGCGDQDEGAGSQPETTATTTATGDVQVDGEGVALRVDRFSPMPASSMARGSIKPTAWQQDERAELPVQEQVFVGRFDPEAMKAVQQYRVTTKIKEGGL
jgi:hypothetical protein